MAMAVKAGAASLEAECAGNWSPTARLRPSSEDVTSVGLRSPGAHIAPDGGAATSLLSTEVKPASGRDGGS